MTSNVPVINIETFTYVSEKSMFVAEASTVFGPLRDNLNGHPRSFIIKGLTGTARFDFVRIDDNGTMIYRSTTPRGFDAHILND